MPHSILKLKKRGFIAKDMYKAEMPEIATNAGLILLFVSSVSLLITPLIFRLLSYSISFNGEMDYHPTNFVVIMVVSIFAIYGLIDDLVDVGRKLKILFPLFFTLPLSYMISIEPFSILIFGNVNIEYELFKGIFFEDFIRFLLIPIYIMVVSNLVNMHSGYNGLQSGLSTILVFTLLIKSIQESIFEIVEVGVFFLGSILGFLYYNIYPARVFEGNIGSLLFGSLIGCLIVVQQEWFFGFFILIPHTFNFLLWIFWLIQMKYKPHIYLNSESNHQKFGIIKEDGCLDVPFPLTLKWVPNYFFRISEMQSTHIMYFITLIFCITGLILF